MWTTKSWRRGGSGWTESWPCGFGSIRAMSSPISCSTGIVQTRGMCGISLSSSSIRARSGRPASSPAQRQRQLAEARQAFGWLRDGSSSVQQQALRDFDRAVAGFFKGTRGRPTWRRKHQHEGFCVRETKLKVHKRKWVVILVPKLGWVRFRLSRPLPSGALGMARITREKSGRWHVSFPAPQPAVPDLGRSGRSVGIDRGVATTIATSDGELLRGPIMRSSERRRLARLQASLARQGKGSRRGPQTKLRIAGLHREVALPVRNMVRRLKPRPDPDNPGHFLPNGEAAKAGLNRSIHANCWGMIAAAGPQDDSVRYHARCGVRAVFQSAMPRVRTHVTGKPSEPSGVAVSSLRSR
jgi:putative transposase